MAKKPKETKVFDLGKYHCYMDKNQFILEIDGRKDNTYYNMSITQCLEDILEQEIHEKAKKENIKELKDAIAAIVNVHRDWKAKIIELDKKLNLTPEKCK